LEVDISGHVVRFPEGTALQIPAGAHHSHKARGLTEVVRLFLVEEACEFAAGVFAPTGGAK
jgi:quercetin dioxygenase-like cupin family protein